MCDESAVSEMNESMAGGDHSSRALLPPSSSALALDKDKAKAEGASGIEAS